VVAILAIRAVLHYLSDSIQLLIIQTLLHILVAAAVEAVHVTMNMAVLVVALVAVAEAKVNKLAALMNMLVALVALRVLLEQMVHQVVLVAAVLAAAVQHLIIRIHLSRVAGMHGVAVVAVGFSPVQAELVKLLQEELAELAAAVLPLVALVQTIVEAQPQVVVDGVHLAVKQWVLVVLAVKLLNLTARLSRGSVETQPVFMDPYHEVRSLFSGARHTYFCKWKRSRHTAKVRFI
jgi:hypothetical protein